MKVSFEGRTVHNGHYLEASFLYQLQTLLGTTPDSPKVMDGKIVRREGTELYIDLELVPRTAASTLRDIARRESPEESISSGEMAAFMDEHYYELTRPYPTLQALLRERPYRDNPNWLEVPVDSLTFQRLRVLRIQKDRIADALVDYFDNGNRVLYPEGTVIVAESIDKQGNFVEAEVLRKRSDTFWNFAVYGPQGALRKNSIAFNEESEPARRDRA